ncbi:MAG: hypothetical protein HGA90_00630 [Alphaproteobacteria bacterium]|nr:hypothetical protein [Alphaproteobacteria bacterium]
MLMLTLGALRLSAGLALFGFVSSFALFFCAIGLMTKVSRLNPGLPPAWEGLAKFHQRKNDLPGAIECWRKALALLPERHDWRTQYLLLLRQVCDWREPVGDVAKLLPQAAIVLTDDPSIQKESAVRYATARFGRIAPLLPSLQNREGGRIRLGYLSSDFHAHATAYLMAELFSLQDRSKFEVFAYSYGVEDGSAIRRRLQTEAEHFVELNKLTAEQAAERICADGIDVLIDLKGYTRGSQLEILAYRPAPAQMHWLGFPGTLGADFVDYFVGDSVTIPGGVGGEFTEKIIRLPHCYQINDRQRAIGETRTRASYGLPKEGLVLASFNQTYKITPEIFAVWCSVLRQTSGSLLWLYQSNEFAPDNLRRAAEEQGLDPTRLVFAEPLPLPQHLARYAQVDLALDTFPVGGHTTTSDALWAGVPVVTLAGQSFVSRVAASILTAAALPQLVTTSLEDYRKLVFGLAHDAEARARLKQHLRDKREHLPLFDTPRFVRDFEVALTGVLRATKKG